MSEAIEIRLTNMAQKVADMYKNKIEPKYYEQLCNAIMVCRKCYENEIDNWGAMYEVVLADGGIWEYIDYDCFEEEIQNMWILVMDILTCNCYLGCDKEHDVTPQDMEIQGENIPDFVELLEKLIGENIDYDGILTFWDSTMCY